MSKRLEFGSVVVLQLSSDIARTSLTESVTLTELELVLADAWLWLIKPMMERDVVARAKVATNIAPSFSFNIDQFLPLLLASVTIPPYLVNYNGYGIN